MTLGLTDYVSPKLELRRKSIDGQNGVYTTRIIQKGELIVVWGGNIVTSQELAALSLRIQRSALQVEGDLYIVSSTDLEICDYINHSCDPNAGLCGQITLVAIRTIMPGEEICYDYAMSDGSDYDEFECKCGATCCRGLITGCDWELPEIQRKYAEYFSPYIQKRIHSSKL